MTAGALPAISAQSTIIVWPGATAGALKMGDFMKHVGLLLTACATIAVAAPAAAQTQSGGVSVGVTGGTLGIGPELGYRGNSFGVRANATFLGIGRDVDSDGINYDGDLKLRSFGAMVDFYPFGGGFRISPGARITRNRVELVATPTEDVRSGTTSTRLRKSAPSRARCAQNGSRRLSLLAGPAMAAAAFISESTPARCSRAPHG